MKLYLAGRYTRKNEVAGYAAILTAAGHEITSTWFEEPHDATVQLADVRDEKLRTYAERDLQEIEEADMFVMYSEIDQTLNKRGGRHVEHGYALALGKHISVIGPRENIFHYLNDQTTHFSSTQELIEALKA